MATREDLDTKAPSAAPATKNAPKSAAPVEPSPDVRLAEENRRLRDQLEAAGIRPDPEPYEPSFPMSEGVRADLAEQRTRADRDGRAYDATDSNGDPLYRVQDPATGRWFTIDDLPEDVPLVRG